MVSNTDEYWSWAYAFRSTQPLHTVLSSLIYLPHQLRKALLGLTRTQAPVIEGTTIYDSVAPLLHHNVLVPSSQPSIRIDFVRWICIPFYQYVRDYSDSFIYPGPASIVAHAVRVAPFLNSDGLDELASGCIAKEISAAINIYDVSTFRYFTFLSPSVSARNTSFCSRLSPSPEISIELFRVFTESRHRLHNQLIFPDLGKKTIGQLASADFWRAYHAFGCDFMTTEPDQYEVVSPLACMRLLIDTGFEVSGPVEMRCSWKFNQITPRVYYARGGDTMSTSLFIQPIINILIDMFPEVHRFNRFSPLSMEVSEHDLLVLYDYSSFTSNLFEIRRFVFALSEFYRGTVVRLVHPRYGVINKDLGELFCEYNDVCNLYADFDISRVVDSVDGPCVLSHTNGMLGVPGNIFLATLLHGIFTRYVAGSGRARCVGDDALMIYRKDSFDEEEVLDLLEWRVSALAPIAREKFCVMMSDREPDSQAFRYVKRPITIRQGIVEQGFLFTIPSLSTLFRFSDDWHFNPPSSSHECRVCFKSVCRMISDFVHFQFVLKEAPFSEVLVTHVLWVVREIKKKDPEGKHSVFARQDVSARYAIPHSSMWGSVTYEEWLLGDLGYEEELRFPKWGGGSDDIRSNGKAGSVIEGVRTRGRGMLVKLGYLLQEDMYDVVSVKSVGFDFLRVYIDGDYKAVSRYHVVRDIPSFYAQVPGIL